MDDENQSTNDQSGDVEEKIDETLANQDVDPAEVEPDQQAELADEMEESSES